MLNSLLVSCTSISIYVGGNENLAYVKSVTEYMHINVNMQTLLA